MARPRRYTILDVFADRPLAGNPLAVAAVLEGIHIGLDKGFDEGLRVDMEWSNKLAASKDAVEGITAFLQKREPKFTGE